MLTYIASVNVIIQF